MNETERRGEPSFPGDSPGLRFGYFSLYLADTSTDKWFSSSGRNLVIL